MEQEIFKDIPGYKGLYQISNLENCKSLQCNKERILRPATKYKSKYYGLYKNGKIFTVKGAALIDLAFNGVKIPKKVRNKRIKIPVCKNIQPIIDRVCAAYLVTEAAVQSLLNIEEVREARQMIYFIAANYTNVDYYTIGLMVGGKDRTSIYHAKKKIGNLIESDKNLRKRYRNIVIDLYNVDTLEPVLKLTEVYKLITETFGVNGLIRFKNEYKKLNHE